MYKITFILIFLCAFSVQAQKIKAKIVYKSGEKISGSYKKTNRFHKFKSNTTKKYEELTPEEIETIDYIILTEKKKSTKYAFTDYGLLEIEYYGTYIMVYSRVTYTYGFGSVGARQITPKTEVYIEKKGQKGLWQWPNGLLLSFKKKVSEYFKDCPALVKRIESKAFKKKNVVTIAKFYDRTCKGVDPKNRKKKG